MNACLCVFCRAGWRRARGACSWRIVFIKKNVYPKSPFFEKSLVEGPTAWVGTCDSRVPFRQSARLKVHASLVEAPRPGLAPVIRGCRPGILFDSTWTCGLVKGNVPQGWRRARGACSWRIVFMQKNVYPKLASLLGPQSP